ncbi:MAG: elongation factor P [Candidatus Brocadiae bacterium]|nr:elongation factor P [Candidatus Brocadiia bacterium]
MITSNDLKNGMTLILRGVLHEIIYFQHIKPGKGHAFVRTKLRNLQNGSVIENTFRAKEPVEQAYVERKTLEYIYRDGQNYYLMDPETYEQLPVSADRFKDSAQYLRENTEIVVTFHGSDILGVTIPDTVDLKVTQAPPGVKGDTATGGSKPVTLETGAIVQAPLFINAGDSIRVDTRTGNYVTRV